MLVPAAQDEGRRYLNPNGGIEAPAGERGSRGFNKVVIGRLTHPMIPLRHQHFATPARRFTLEQAQRTQLPPGQGMCARGALLDATDVQGGLVEVDLVPAQVHKLSRAVGRADRRSGSSSSPDDPSGWPPIDFRLGEVLAGAQLGIGQPARCPRLSIR
jgi:hypothetical protein